MGSNAKNRLARERIVNVKGPSPGSRMGARAGDLWQSSWSAMVTAETSRSSGRAAFRYPGFFLFQMARFFVVLATEMQSVAVGWQVYEITKRPLDLGYVGLAQFLPGIVLFLVSGHVA